MFPPDTPVGRIGEKALLRYIRSRIAHGRGVAIGIGDDAAAVETGRVTLITTDSLVEGVHFRREWTTPVLLGRKALSVNLSDIEAMGGTSRYATLSLSLPADTPFGVLQGFYDGLLSRAGEAAVEVVGGNLSGTSGGMVVDVTLLGEGEPILPRGGAVAGDVALVTGRLGAAALGVRLLAGGKRLDALGAGDSAVRRCLLAQLDPDPPLGFGRAVASRGLARAAIDLSDGLSGDLLTVCQESGVAAWINGEAVPVDPAVAALAPALGLDPLDVALHGGEEYQLMLAAAPETVPGLRALAEERHVTLSVVGGFARGEPGLTLVTAHGPSPLQPRSHEHFGG